MQKTGRLPPEKLAQWFDKQEPLRFLSGPALALYLAAIVLGMLLFTFAVAKDYEWLQPKPAAAAESRPADLTSSAAVRPIF